MLYQDDPEFEDSPIFDTGCHLLCFLRALELFVPCQFSHEEVLKILKIGQEKGFLSKESFVIFPDTLLDFLFPGRFQYFTKLPADDIQSTDIVMALWHWETKNLKHFVLVPTIPDGNVLYDPIQGGSQTVKYGRYKNFRVIRDLLAQVTVYDYSS